MRNNVFAIREGIVFYKDLMGNVFISSVHGTNITLNIILKIMFFLNSKPVSYPRILKSLCILYFLLCSGDVRFVNLHQCILNMIYLNMYVSEYFNCTFKQRRGSE